MNVVVAIDSFKGSLSSIEVGMAVKSGILKAYPNCDVKVIPLADGGEGTIAALTGNDDTKRQYISSFDANLRPINASYGILNDIAVIEVAEAVGLPLVKDNLDPLHASSYGVGLLINAALQKGFRKFIVGLGGSATNDGGIGMLDALGYKFYDNQEKLLQSNPTSLGKIVKIDDSSVSQALKESSFTIASDVSNPLCGLNGATYIFGKQKGVKENQMASLDASMQNYAKIANYFLKDGIDYSLLPGTGAAGGLGFAFVAFLKARIESGVNLILKTINFQEIIKNAEYVITGEGKLDSQTVMGKAPAGVAKIAKEQGKKVLLFAGGISDDLDEYNSYGFDAYFPVVRGITNVDEALDKSNATSNIIKSVEQVFKLIKIEKGN